MEACGSSGDVAADEGGDSHEWVGSNTDEEEGSSSLKWGENECGECKMKWSSENEEEWCSCSRGSKIDKGRGTMIHPSGKKRLVRVEDFKVKTLTVAQMRSNKKQKMRRQWKKLKEKRKQQRSRGLVDGEGDNSSSENSCVCDIDPNSSDVLQHSHTCDRARAGGETEVSGTGGGGGDTAAAVAHTGPVSSKASVGPGQAAVAAEEEEQGVKQEGVKGNEGEEVDGSQECQQVVGWESDESVEQAMGSYLEHKEQRLHGGGREKTIRELWEEEPVTHKDGDGAETGRGHGVGSDAAGVESQLVLGVEDESALDQQQPESVVRDLENEEWLELDDELMEWDDELVEEQDKWLELDDALMDWDDEAELNSEGDEEWDEWSDEAIVEVQDESASSMVEGVGGDEAEVGAEVEAVVEKAQREEADWPGAAMYPEPEEHEWAVEMSTGEHVCGSGSVVLGSGVDAKGAVKADTVEAEADPCVIGDALNPAHDAAAVLSAAVTNATITPDHAATPVKCVNVSKISDVPPANALVVDSKALKQEQALERVRLLMEEV